MGRKALLTRGLVVLLAEFAVFAALLFVPAKTVLWPAGWVFLVIFFGLGLSLMLWLARDDPELLAERLASPLQRGQPLWDKMFLAAASLLFIAWLILMPLDAMRFEWSEVPGWLQFLGALELVLSLYVVFLTFRENAYLAPVGGEAPRGAGPERGEYWPLPVREASHVFEHVLSGDHTPAG